jgi:K+-sensing histidine kinase KdpD
MVFKTIAIDHSAIPPGGERCYFSKTMVESQLRNPNACGKMGLSQHTPQERVMPGTSDKNSARYEPLQPRHLSHDLRGPLNAILGFTELLLDDIEGPLNDIQREDIAAMRKSALSLLELINTMVDLSKSDVKGLKLLSGPVEFKSLIADAAASPGLQNLAIELDLPDNLPSVEADRNRVKQMIRYPLQFVQTKKATRVVVKAYVSDNEVTMQLTAHDVALPETDLAELFEATAKIDDTGRSKLTAGGLFLPLVGKLAIAQNGRVVAYNTPGTGLTIELGLPVFKPE